MDNRKYSLTLFLLTLFTAYFLTGCASSKNWDTFQKKSTFDAELNGKADLNGAIRMATNIDDIIFNRFSNTYAFSTEVRIEPGNLKAKSDRDGKFNFKSLNPGEYSIYFIGTDKKEKRTDVNLETNCELNLVIYFQGDYVFHSPIPSLSNVGGEAEPAPGNITKQNPVSRSGESITTPTAAKDKIK